MALTITTRDKEASMASITVDRRLWLAEDGETLVEDGDDKAAFLWAHEGREVHEDEAKRVGYKPKSSRSKSSKGKSAQGDES